MKEALNIYDEIDVLVNNAGYIKGALIEALEYVDPYDLNKLIIILILTNGPSYLVLLDYLRDLRRTSSGLEVLLALSCPILEKNLKVLSYL